MTDTRKQIIINYLEQKLVPFIEEYTGYLDEKSKKKSLISKAFFDIAFYVKTGHGEKGYLQRIKLINAAKESTDIHTLLETINNFYGDCNTTSTTQQAIKDIYFDVFRITQAMIDEVAKAYDSSYKAANAQDYAKGEIMKWLLDGDLNSIELLRQKALYNDGEIKFNAQ